jgi:tetratricopeptide (TPR) repeat protein
MLNRSAIFLRVVIPFFFLIVLDCWPAPRIVGIRLAEARSAEAGGRPGDLAAALAALAQIQPYRNLEEKIAFAQLSAGAYDQAIDSFAKVNQSSALSAQGMMAWADGLEQAGRIDEAIWVWGRVDQATTLPETSRRLSILLRKQGKFTDAAAAALEWQKRAPQDARAAYQLGLLQVVDSPEEASRWISLAASLDPSYQAAVGTLRLAQGQAELNGDQAYRDTVMGRWLGAQEAWDVAEYAFGKAVANNPDYAEALAFLGQARLEQNREGLNDLVNAVRINPQSVLSRVLLASYYARNSDFDRAILQMQAAAQLEPERAIWQIELGNFSAEAGDLVTANAYFARARELEPDNSQVWEGTARFSLSYSVDLRGLGLPAARRLISILPVDPVGYDLAGAVLAGLGDFRSAERFLHRAIETQTGYAPSYLRLGQVYLQLSDLPWANYYLSQAVRIDPDGETGKAAQRLLERYLGKGYSP